MSKINIFKLAGSIVVKDEASRTLKDVERNVESTRGKFSNFQDGLSSVGKKASEIGGTMTKKVTLPIIGMGGMAIKTGMDFEKSMSSVKAISGATGQDLQDLEDIAREMGKSTAFSASEAAEGLEYMALAGWDNKTMVDSLPSVLKLASAGNLDLGRASDLVTDSMSAMGIESENLGGYLDVVAQAAASSNTDIDAMMEAYVGVGGVLRGLDVPVENSAVALGMLANAGIKGSEAGNSLSAILTNLTAPTGRAKEALDDLGFSAFDSEGNFKGLDEVLFELQDSMEGMTTEEQNMYKSMIGGKGNIDTINALLNGLDDSYEELSESIGDSKDALDDMEEAMTDNLQGSVDGMMSSLGELGISFYQMADGPVRSFVDSITNIIDWFSELSDETKQWIIIALGIGAAIGPILVIVGKLIVAFTTISGVLAPIGAAVGGAFAAISAPMVAVGVAVAAIVVIFIQLYRKSEEFREGVHALFDGLKEVLSDVMDFIGTVLQVGFDIALDIFNIFKALFTGDFEGFKEAISSLAENLMEGVKAIFKAGWDLVKSIFSLGVDLVKGIVKLGFNIIKNIISVIFQSITGLLSKAWNFISGIFGGTIDNIRERVRNGFERIKEFMSNPIEFAKDKISGVLDTLKNIFINKPSEMLSSVTAKFREIKDKIWQPVEEAKDKISGIIDNIKGFFTGLDLSIPKIKLPKLPKPKIEGRFSMTPPSVPKISWNAKGGIFRKPTIFDTPNGLQGVGEAGAEAIIPISNLRDWMDEWFSADEGVDREARVINPNRSIDRLAEAFMTKERRPAEVAKLAEPTYNFTFNIEGDWTVDSDERQQSVVEEFMTEIEKYLRDRGLK